MNLDYTIILEKLPQLFKGAIVTMEVSIFSLLLGTAIGVVFAFFRISSIKVLRGISGFYIWIVRGTPLIVQLFILYFGLPQLGIRLSGMTAGILGLGLNTGAYVTEIIRSGIQSIDTGQMEAALSLGMSYPKAMRRVIGPQVIKVTTAPLLNQFIISLKNSSLVSLVTITELMRSGEQLIYTTFRSFEVYTTIAVFYLAMCSVLMGIAKYVENKMMTE